MFLFSAISLSSCVVRFSTIIYFNKTYLYVNILCWLLLRWLLLGWLLLTFSLYKTPIGETGCLSNPYSLFYWLPKHAVFWFTSNSPLTESVRFSVVTYPHCAAPVWLMGHHAMLLVTRCFPPQSLTSSLTLPWAITRFLDPFYMFSLAHRRKIWDFSPTPT